MLRVLQFILSCVIDFAKMLFTIDLGDGLNLGLLFCIVFIFLPIVHRVICFIKQDAMEELSNAYEESRPRETWTSSEDQHLSLGPGRSFSTYHTRSRSRRYRL